MSPGVLVVELASEITVRLRQALEYGAIPVIEDFSDFKGCDVSGLPLAVDTARALAEDMCARGSVMASTRPVG
jgi:hypothetical protein